MSEEQALYIADRTGTLKEIAGARPQADRELVEKCFRRLDDVVGEFGELGLIALEMVVILKRIEFGGTELVRLLWPVE